MAVYTHLSSEEIHKLLEAYDLGAVKEFKGITAGVSNTNYSLTTERGRFILTLFEPHRVRADDVPYFLNYSLTLERSGIPCPQTMRRKDGAYHALFKDRPAAIFSYLKGEGATPQDASVERCKESGAILARMHQAAGAIPDGPDNAYSLLKWTQWVKDLSPRMGEIKDGLGHLIQAEHDFIRANWPQILPRGAIHGDYFPDNVFFEKDDVSGVIDFHFVCKDFFAYDLAIAINAWCFDAQNVFQQDRMDAFMNGYQSARPLNNSEAAAFPILLRAAALRFLLSRIEEKLNWKPGDFMTPHDPMVFERRLRHFRREEL
jgi:homoserine kinase type II